MPLTIRTSVVKRVLTRIAPWYSWHDEQRTDTRVEELVRRSEDARRTAIRAAYQDAERRRTQ